MRKEVQQRILTDSKRKLRRNIKLRLKEGLYEDLRETPKVDKRKLLDDGF